MILRVLLCGFLALIYQRYAQAIGPPPVTGSYRAYGEIVDALQDESHLVPQIAFEENYDAETQNAAFSTWTMGKNVTFIENFSTNQTFRYINGKECDLITVDEWINTTSPPALSVYEDTNGTVRFSLKQLFSLSDNYLAEYNMSAVYRGIPARKWMYDIRGKEANGSRRMINIYAYWSEESWNTTSPKKSVPLGFTIVKVLWWGRPGFKVHDQFINVFGFVHDTFNRKVFEPLQGVVCPNRAPTLAFPDVKDWQAVAIHSEVISPDYQEIRYVDTWFNPLTKMLKVELEIMKDEDPIFETKERRFHSEIVSGKMGIVYKVTHFKGKVDCSVIPIENYEIDMQSLFNFKRPVSQWKLGKLFGVNESNYIHTGKTTKRDIPCHIFQGIRTDWPEPAANVTSLWEWCFYVNMTGTDDIAVFRDREFGLINVEIKILESGSPADYPEGYRMIHHFYGVKVKNSDIMDATAFDITGCFDETEKKDMQFAVDWKVTKDNIMLVENATSDLTFLQRWKAAIYQQSEIRPESMRVGKIRSTVSDNQLYVKFTLLGPHKDLPDNLKKTEKTGFDAENTLRDNINAGKLSIHYLPDPDKDPLRLFATKHSLQFQLNRTFEPHTLPPTTPTTPTTERKFPFSLETDPDDHSSYGTRPTGTGTGPTVSVGPPVTGSTVKPKEKRHVYTGHQPGTVATISIAMLLVGVTIGSAGTFYKFVGLPSCFTGSQRLT